MGSPMAESTSRPVRDALVLFLLLFVLWLALDLLWWRAAAVTVGHIIWRVFSCLMVCAVYVVGRWLRRGQRTT